MDVPIGPARIVHGPGTREWVALIRDCPALAVHGLAAVGITWPGPRLYIGGDDWFGSVAVASVAGAGECWCEGRWRPLPAGSWYQVTPRTMYGYRSTGRAWTVAWLVWRGVAGPHRAESGTRIVAHPVDPYLHLLQALRDELQSSADASALSHLCWLVNRAGFQACGENVGPLQALWQAVEAAPMQRWTLPGLARRAGLSPESLRKACHRETGRSPMQQVLALRMRVAASRIAAGGSVAEAAAAVGYRNAFAFSTAFRRLTGVPPSWLRRHDLTGTPAARA